MKFKLYTRLTEDIIDDNVSGDGEIYASDSIGSKGYVISNLDGFKSFQLEEIFTLDKVSGIESDPLFEKIYPTENDIIKSSNYFFTAYFGGNKEFPYFEYGAISSSESELYLIMKDINIQEAIIGSYFEKFGKQKMVYRYRKAFPFKDGK